MKGMFKFPKLLSLPNLDLVDAKPGVDGDFDRSPTRTGLPPT